MEKESKTIQEYRYRMMLIHKVMKKRLMMKIPISLIKKLDVNEQSSLLMGLLKQKNKENGRGR